MNIDRVPGDFQRTHAEQGVFGRAWSGVKHWSSENPRLSRVVWFAVGLALLALLIWAIYPAKQINGRGRFGGNGAQPVGVARALSGDIDVTLNALGTVTPLATATVRPQVGGMLVKINFTEGQMVKAGDVLAQIDPRPYQAALDQVRGQLARDSATLANAKVDLQRYKTLEAQGASYPQQVDTQAALVKSDAGIVVADQANVETARINLGYTNIVSPVAGRAGIHLVDIGNIVSAGQTNGIVVVTQLQPMSVLFTIPEDNISKILQRMSGNTLPVEVWDRGQTVKITTGTLSAVDSVVDTTTGSVKLRALFDNTDLKLFPSQFVNVKLYVDTVHDAVIVPVAAIQRGADGSFVFVVTPDKTVSQRTVKTGVQDGDRIQIASGLKAGDTVVVDGADRLRDGADVEIPAGGKIVAPSGGGVTDAARTARRKAAQAAINKSCSADIAKLCDGAKPGSPEARRCLFQHRDDLSAECTKAMSQLRRGGGGRGGFGGGGGGPGGGGGAP